MKKLHSMTYLTLMFFGNCTTLSIDEGCMILTINCSFMSQIIDEMNTIFVPKSIVIIIFSIDHCWHSQTDGVSPGFFQTLTSSWMRGSLLFIRVSTLAMIRLRNSIRFASLCCESSCQHSTRLMPCSGVCNSGIHLVHTLLIPNSCSQKSHTCLSKYPNHSLHDEQRFVDPA